MNKILSIIIPSRNEAYLQRTIEDVLSNAEGNIEVLAMLDGYTPDPQIVINDNRVIFVHFEKPVGQREAINQGARMAKGKHIMKLDAHCAVDKGFDVKLASDCEYGCTMIPRMYNLDESTWQPKKNKWTDYMYITSPEHKEKPFRIDYYGYKYQMSKRNILIDDMMVALGACWFMHKDRFWELGGMDNGHSSWGQVGIEVALKAWLSDGSHKVNKKTWFAHLFRKSFPYHITHSEQEVSRKYSQDIWLNDKWDKATKKLQWLIDKFNPPGWEDKMVTPIQRLVARRDLTILFYTANRVSSKILTPVVRSLKRHHYPIVSVSQEAMDLGVNIVVPKAVSLQNIYRQVLEGAKKVTTKYVALCEDDCLYVPEHFEHIPVNAPFAYNLNRWLLHLDEQVYSYRRRPVLSQCIADREELIKNLEERFALPSIPDKYCGEMGCFEKQLGMTEYTYETFETKDPNLVVCHDRNTMGRKFLGNDAEPKTEMNPWGKVDYWVNKFTAPRRQHSHIHGRAFLLDELVNRLEHYWDWRKKDRYPFYKESVPAFYQAVHEGKQFTDEELKAHPYYAYIVSRMLPEVRERPDVIERCLFKIKEGIEFYHSIKENGLYHPIDMWWEKGKLNLYRGSRRLAITKLLGYETIPVRMFNSREMMMKFLPDRHDKPNDSSINGLALKQFVKFQHRATDKGWFHNYTPLYDIYLWGIREKINKVLEIGVHRGASLLLWCDVFPNAEIYGIDKNIRQAVMIDNNPRIHLLEGRQEDEKFLKDKVIPEGKFDVIIDDGGHRSYQQKTALSVLWDSLNSGGFYVIEDLYHNLYDKAEREGDNTFKTLKNMIDEMNFKGDIASMHFYYNICFVEKR